MLTSSKRQRALLLSVVCASLALIWPCVPTAPAQEKAKEKAGQTEKATLQYRVARDAFAPSRFVAVIDKGISAPPGHYMGPSQGGGPKEEGV